MGQRERAGRGTAGVCRGTSEIPRTLKASHPTLNAWAPCPRTQANPNDLIKFSAAKLPLPWRGSPGQAEWGQAGEEMPVLLTLQQGPLSSVRVSQQSRWQPRCQTMAILSTPATRLWELNTTSPGSAHPTGWRRAISKIKPPSIVLPTLSFRCAKDSVYTIHIYNEKRLWLLI